MQDEVEAELRENFLGEAENTLMLLRKSALRSDNVLNYFLLRVGHMRVLGLITQDEASDLKRRTNEAILDIWND